MRVVPVVRRRTQSVYDERPSMVVSFEDARAMVVREIITVSRRRSAPAEVVALSEAHGRVLAADVTADRDQPPFHRSTRDGFAVRAADVASVPIELDVLGEIAAGTAFAGTVGVHQAVEIMTGAPLPTGADAVVRVEHVDRTDGRVRVRQSVSAGENVVAQGSEARAGATVLAAGSPIGAAAIGLLASVGCEGPVVARRPVVSIVTTGDELVELGEAPSPTQIRNSNRHALAVQVASAGAVARPSRIARDTPAELEAALREALVGADVLLVTGGVSAGKHDHVEAVLAALGARVVFDGVAMRPGRPLVFGFVGDVPFFGLPGNPVSTFVTFELFVRPALALLQGARVSEAPMRRLARLADVHRQGPLSLTAFVPAARAGADALEVRVLASQGSGDLVAMAAADALMVVPPGTTSIGAGELVSVIDLGPGGSQ